jgi:hypothetical protein
VLGNFATVSVDEDVGVDREQRSATAVDLVP